MQNKPKGGGFVIPSVCVCVRAFSSFLVLPRPPHSPSVSPSCFLSLQLSFASLLASLPLPSPVTLEGFNHQLNVTPYLRSPIQTPVCTLSLSHTHTRASHLPSLWGSYTFSNFIFFFYPASDLKGERDKTGDLPHANCWALFAYVMFPCSSYNLDKVGDKHTHISEYRAAGAATEPQSRCSASI